MLVCVPVYVPVFRTQLLSRSSGAVLLNQSLVRVSPLLSQGMSLKRDDLGNGSL